MELITVAAVAANGVIGNDGDLPWPSIPADREQYRRRVSNHPVILGRRTYESMREDVPGRVQIVLSRSTDDLTEERVHHAVNVEDAIEIVRKIGSDRAYVLGGAQIYELFQPHVDRMILSRIHEAYPGDAYFPTWDPAEWTCVDRTEFERFTLEEWVRDNP